MAVSLNRVINTTVTRNTQFPSRRGFGTILIAAYHNVFPERVKLYADPADMITDGFTATEAAYIEALAAMSQSPRPPSIKIGRRAGAPVQSLVFTPSAPSTGEKFGFDYGEVRFEVTAGAGDAVADVIDDLVTLMEADVDAVVVTGATAATAQSLTGTDLDGVNAGTLSPPRNVTITVDTHADWDLTTATVTGLDKDGRVQTETYSIPDGGNATLTGAKVFSAVTQIDIPAQSGTGGTFTVGVGVVFANAALDFTATDNTTNLGLAADNAGDWFAVTDPTSNLAINDNTAEPAITLATDLDAMEAEDADFWALSVADAQSDAQIQAVSAWVESKTKAYVFHTFDADVLDPVDTDVVSTIRGLSRVRSLPFISPGNSGRGPVGAFLGKVMPLDPGSWTAAFKNLSGIAADSLSAAEVERIIGSQASPTSGKSGIIYAEVRPDGVNTGNSVTLGGLTTGPEWFDVVQGIDFTNSLIQSNCWTILLNANKVPFTGAGIDAFVGQVRSALETAASAPYSFLDPDSIEVTFTKLEDVAAVDRQARYYDGVQWSARVAGAIHALRIRGTVSP